MSRIALLVLLVAVGCVRAQRPPAPEGGLSTPDGAVVSDAAFVEKVRDASFILIGEGHDSSCDHLVQTRLVRALGEARVPFVLGLEMATIDRFEPLDRFNAGTLALDDLDEAIDWPKMWGFSYALYAPVLDAARAGGAPVVALNAPKPLLARIGTPVDDQPERVRARLAPQIVGPVAEQDAYLKEAFDAHAQHLPAGTDPAAAFESFRRTQSAWDSQMAFAAAEERRATGRLVVVLAGAGHVMNGWGIQHRLVTFAPGARVVSVLPARVGAAADLQFACP